MTEHPQRGEEAAFFQKPSFNARERLICSHLIEGINATPLGTVLHTMQAALLLDAEKLDDLYIDMEQVVSIYTVAQRLAAAKPITPYNQDPQFYVVHTLTLDFEKDVKPWLKIKYYPHFNKTGRWDKLDKKEYDEFMEESSPKQAFDHANKSLSIDGYEALVSDFLEYASPRVQEIGGKLALTVNPETYTELLRLMRGEKT